MIQLILSLIALFVGILAYPLIRRYTALLSFFDAFVLISIIGLCFLHLIPHSIAETGFPGLIAVGVGLGLPLILHRLKGKDHSDCEDGLCDHEHTKPHHSKHWLLALAVIGVLAHTLLDGVGLSMVSFDVGETNVGALLGLGVLFHRLPVGIFLAMLLMPKYGWRITLAIATLMGLATVAGFGLGITAQGGLDLGVLYIVQALISGTLLHAVFHDISVEGRKPVTGLFAVPQALGVFVAVTALMVVEAYTHGGHSHAGEIVAGFMQVISTAGLLWLVAAVVLVVLALSLSEKRREQCFDLFLTQNSPAINDKGIKFLSLAPLLLLFSVFQWQWAAFAMLGLAVTQIFAHYMARSIPYCSDCRATLAENRCARHREVVLEHGVGTNTFLKGLASLFRAREIVAFWTKIFLFVGILVLLPNILTPIRDLMTSLSDVYPYFYMGALLLVILAVGVVYWRGSQLGPLRRLMAMAVLFFVLPESAPLLLKLSLWLAFAYFAFIYDYASYRELRDEVAQHKALGRLRALHLGVLLILLSLGGIALFAQYQTKDILGTQTFSRANFSQLEAADHHAHAKHEDHEDQLPKLRLGLQDQHKEEPQLNDEELQGDDPALPALAVHDTLETECAHAYGPEAEAASAAADVPPVVHVHAKLVAHEPDAHAAHDTLETECAHAYGPEARSDSEHHLNKALRRLTVILFAFFGFCYICQFGPRRMVEFASGTDPREHDHG